MPNPSLPSSKGTNTVCVFSILSLEGREGDGADNVKAYRLQSPDISSVTPRYWLVHLIAIC
jgi:hypothetical protein